MFFIFLVLVNYGLVIRKDMVIMSSSLESIASCMCVSRLWDVWRLAESGQHVAWAQGRANENGRSSGPASCPSGGAATNDPPNEYPITIAVFLTIFWFLKPMLILYIIDLCSPSFNGAGWETNGVGQWKWVRDQQRRAWVCWYSRY